MSFRTTIAIAITIALTVLIIQNTDEATFTILFVPVKLPKLAILTAVSAGGFLLGLLVSRPKKRKYNNIDQTNQNGGSNENNKFDTLSDEDRDYIS